MTGKRNSGSFRVRLCRRRQAVKSTARRHVYSVTYGEGINCERAEPLEHCEEDFSLLRAGDDAAVKLACIKGVPADEEGSAPRQGRRPSGIVVSQERQSPGLTRQPCSGNSSTRFRCTFDGPRMPPQPNTTQRREGLLACRRRISSIYAAWVNPKRLSAAVLDRYKTLKHNMLHARRGARRAVAGPIDHECRRSSNVEFPGIKPARPV